MEYNYIEKDGKQLKIGIYSLMWTNSNTDFFTYQKKVFDFCDLKINQLVENTPHGLWLNRLSQQENVDYLIFFDQDAIPLRKDFLQVVIDRMWGKIKILGIEQRTNHIPNSIPYAGPSCFVISKDTYNLLGQPSYSETPRSDVAEELTHICREKGIEVDMFKFKECIQPEWDYGDGRQFGLGTTFEDIAYHNFNSRIATKIEYFIHKCKEVIGELDLHILIHVLPHEIDQLEQTLIQLKRSSKHCGKYNVLVEVALNNNLVDWNESEICEEFFETKFYQLEHLTKSWAQTKWTLEEDGKILGCVSHRRRAFQELTAKALLMLDTNVIFSESLLYFMLESLDTVRDIEQYIITPETTKMWDDSWDVLVNKNYKNGKYEPKIDPYVNSGHSSGEINLIPIKGFKFGGGWATLISNAVCKRIPIPESLGHYGLEDTYIMTCANHMQRLGQDIHQFVLIGEVIVKNSKFVFCPYKDFLHIIDRKKEFSVIANANFQNEVLNFNKTLL